MFENSGLGGAADHELDPCMLDLVHWLDVAGENATVAHQIEQMREEVGRSAAVRAGLDQERRADRPDRLLGRP